MTPDQVLKSMRDAFSMTKQRCYNPKCRDYAYYGGRGITVCDRWLESFDNFVSDMGLRPEGMTLERKDNDGPYSPDNCVWATRAAQSRNTRGVRVIEYRGEKRTMSEWERALGWKPGVLKARLTRLGYTVDEAFSKEVKCGGLLEGRTYAHLKDQSWRNTAAMRAKPLPPKLARSTVWRMRELYNAVAMTFTALGVLFGVSTETASNAVQGLNAYKDF